jgi:hypothetical protein
MAAKSPDVGIPTTSYYSPMNGRDTERKTVSRDRRLPQITHEDNWPLPQQLRIGDYLGTS